MHRHPQAVLHPRAPPVGLPLAAQKTARAQGQFFGGDAGADRIVGAKVEGHRGLVPLTRVAHDADGGMTGGLVAFQFGQKPQRR